MSTTLPSPTDQHSDDASNEPKFDLVEMLLSEQQTLTAVERFSALHDAGDLPEQEPAQATYYRSLLPATAPGPGQQYAFRVDLDACSGCKACVVACHTMNGLEENESWRRVGTVTIGQPESRIQHVTSACHHCVEPGCLSGCPVKAYDKDPETGIVRHLDDQCIGCKYCTMMCPYEVPQYSDRLGIVRKCDMCHQRLSVGEAPACVQSCPNEAISIQIVDENEVAQFPAQVAPGTAPSDITQPTTNYASPSGNVEAFLDAQPHDQGVDEVAEDHWPLALMLVGTQISVGMLLIERIAASILWFGGEEMPIMATRINALVAFVIAAIGLNLAPMHLGQPLRSWRIFLGLRTSWLSREAVVLGKFAGILALAVGLLWLPVISEGLAETVNAWVPTWVAKALLGTSILFGVAGLYCSAMIYIATKRVLWRHSRTLKRFFGTTLAAGAAWTAVAMIYAQASSPLTAIALIVGVAALGIKLDWENRLQFKPTGGIEGDDYDRRSRALVARELKPLVKTRIAMGLASLGLLIAATVSVIALPSLALPLAIGGALTLAVGEGFERLLYFSSVVYDRMPGTLR